jgi:LacI family transcriptional regulator
MRAFLDAGRKVPEDISVIGFDDIQSAAFHNPGLSTVRQPLRRMGILAAQTLLERLANDSPESGKVVVQPELIIRGTTAAPAAGVSG